MIVALLLHAADAASNEPVTPTLTSEVSGLANAATGLTLTSTLTPAQLAQEEAQLQSLVGGVVTSGGGQAALAPLQALQSYINTAGAAAAPTISKIILGLNTATALIQIIETLKAQGETNTQLVQYFAALLLPSQDAAAVNAAIVVGELAEPVIAKIATAVAVEVNKIPAKVNCGC